MTTSSSSLKERAEETIVAELVASPTIKPFLPKKQNEPTKLKLPRISVVASVGREISPGARLFNITVAISVEFKHPVDDPDELDRIFSAIGAQLAAAQARGTYGVMIDGEQGTQFLSDSTIRKRTFSVRLIAG